MVAGERRALGDLGRRDGGARTTLGEVLALAALVAAFRRPVAAIAFGHVALARIGRSGGPGTAPALVGLVVGYLSVAVVVLVLLALLTLVTVLAATVVSASGSLPAPG